MTDLTAAIHLAKGAAQQLRLLREELKLARAEDSDLPRKLLWDLGMAQSAISILVENIEKQETD